MKTWIRLELFVMVFAIAIVGLESCKKKADTSAKELALNDTAVTTEIEKEQPKKPLSEDFKKYWYAGEAEITSYTLEQARYGELREGEAVLIFVTEPFLPEIQVKADGSNPTNVPVLKLNATKNYLTGIYPYSIMSSTFYPVHDNQHAIKTSLSIQEWCGHVYSQLNNRDSFEFTSHSYFEGEADTKTTLEKAYLENEIWNKIRINPSDLPTGELSMVPSLEFFRVKHTPIKAMGATASISQQGDLSTYTIAYKEGIRTLSIQYTTAFPHTIEGWEESYKSGWGSKAKVLTSKATKRKQLNTPYWRQNSNKDVVLRDSLGI